MQIKWNSAKLDDLGKVERGRSRHRPRNDQSLFGGDYPFIQTGEVKAANFYITNHVQTYSEKGLAQSRLWDVDTLCITIAANIADSAILKYPACFPDSIVGFRSYENKSDVRFVKYLLDNLQKEFQLISKGTTQDNLSLEKLLSIKFEVPDYEGQVIIGELLSKYDILIQNNLRRITLLEEMVQTIYAEWFVNFKFPGYEKVKLVDSKTIYGKIPDGWSLMSVEDLLVRVPSGKKYDTKTVNVTGKVPVLDQGKSGVIGYHDEEPGVVASIDSPVIVFANHTCNQNLILHPFSAIQNVLPFLPTGNRNIYWLHWVTKDLIKFNDYKGHWPEFVSKKCVVPEVSLTNKFGEFVAPLVKLRFKLEKQNTILTKTRDQLIPRLVTGEIEIKS